ncbi:MAG: ABC transporter ATP-binding protein [SAR324 cluster bacterium]|nr:ABC transporter ATP-binding protein [SAR324 cluster bacterium]
MLKVQNLAKSFDGFQAVNGANLTVKQGEIVAVIGPNGAGKTTLFNLITGQLKPDSGTIRFKDENIAGLPLYKICRKGISRSYQVVNIFHRATVFENVQVSVISQRRETLKLFFPANNYFIEETNQILESVGLIDKARITSGLLSHGDQKVLEIAVALGSNPELLILDEPTAGMSAEETITAIDMINHLSNEMGLTILICEHDMELVFAVAHNIMVLRQGATIIQAKPDEVKNNIQVQEAYLGGGS